MGQGESTCAGPPTKVRAVAFALTGAAAAGECGGEHEHVALAGGDGALHRLRFGRVPPRLRPDDRVGTPGGCVRLVTWNVLAVIWLSSTGVLTAK
jgi:hypothetical protein